jgi:hypothetical protein
VVRVCGDQHRAIVMAVDPDADQGRVASAVSIPFSTVR